MTVLRSPGKWLWRCEVVLVYASILAAVAMMCLTSADALSRYLLNRPIMGAYEITEKYLMVATIFLGLSYAYRGGVFIRVTFLVDRLPARLKLLAQYLAHLASLLFCLIILVATTQQAVRGLSDDTTLSALPLLVGPAYCLVPLGFFALTVIMLIDLPRVRSGRSHLFREGAPPA
ncbi:MAG TPA: TRAP transporter small permease [Xanthobacteraceae bacterium]|nr:TRAP transporter small permease [Xanthobacteraceae bacterium]